MHEWLAHAAAVLEVDPALVADLSDPVLDMVRDVAHGVVRPAGPMTAFLVGVVAGRAGAAGADLPGVEARVREALADVEDELRRRDGAH
ncbi:molybdopterin-guanine dinucleotide biosynthesis protein MobA [Cellulomonas shaoxiangyii]|uniref:Molybdopterin-guanine dinucleotide biosynthesis protein MobA n=1 Tax=Cellulomonas shaoxiangyii TaxID=2566013 RepID=A0A4V1CN59_9CELL|nr:molybdopterin-guanine dinucleotide biosynthesis protein MobA [Cellulomonas shaoxiangyii]TGY81658.1 molybdopterin-guanine dinucleotide biosynthesis protein MobA [Cellulomonas shaoxiangyii]